MNLTNIMNSSSKFNSKVMGVNRTEGVSKSDTVVASNSESQPITLALQKVGVHLNNFLNATSKYNDTNLKKVTPSEVYNNNLIVMTHGIITAAGLRTLSNNFTALAGSTESSGDTSGASGVASTGTTSNTPNYSAMANFTISYSQIMLAISLLFFSMGQLQISIDQITTDEKNTLSQLNSQIQSFLATLRSYYNEFQAIGQNHENKNGGQPDLNWDKNMGNDISWASDSCFLTQVDLSGFTGNGNNVVPSITDQFYDITTGKYITADQITGAMANDALIDTTAHQNVLDSYWNSSCPSSRSGSITISMKNGVAMPDITASNTGELQYARFGGTSDGAGNFLVSGQKILSAYQAGKSIGYTTDDKGKPALVMNASDIPSILQSFFQDGSTTNNGLVKGATVDGFMVTLTDLDNMATKYTQLMNNLIGDPTANSAKDVGGPMANQIKNLSSISTLITSIGNDQNTITGNNSSTQQQVLGIMQEFQSIIGQLLQILNQLIQMMSQG